MIYSVDFDTLKSLRLACRQYAYLPYLLEKTFQWIRIEASPDQVEVAESVDLSCIRPYVKAVVFVPSKYSWAMTEQKFWDIIWAPRVEEIYNALREKERQIWDAWGRAFSAAAELKKDFEELGLMGLIEKHANGPIQFTKDEVAKGYERYMYLAQRTRELFESKRVERAWVRVLTQLPDVQFFNIGIWEFNCGHMEQDWKKAGCEIEIHPHGQDRLGHSHAVCRRLHASVGEALFRAAVASLIAAQSTVSWLEVECILDDEFIWAHDGTLDNWDLSQLQSLVFNPVGAARQEIEQWSDEHKDAASARCGHALVTLLRKCSSGLTELKFFPDGQYGDNYLVWPPAAPNKPPKLPVLEELTTGANLHLRTFSRYLLQCPSLDYLRLEGCKGVEGLWPELWDAIRDHPNRMLIEFDDLPCNMETFETCSMRYDPKGASSAEDEDDEAADAIEYSLRNYFSGKGHWDHTLSMWFGDWD